MPIIIKGDYSLIDQKLDALTHEPDGDMTAALEAVLLEAAVAVEEAVHVETGSLKSSIKVDSHSTHTEWVGEIHAGGASTGVNNPVDYAIYEKRRGGAHDFFAPLAAFESHFADTIKDHL